jgi:carbonic anhydrase
MQGLLNPDLIQSLPDVSAWLLHAEMTRRIIKDNYSQLEGEALLNATIEENVLVQIENLRTLPSVGSRLVRGDLHLHGWVYVIETGEIFAYDVEVGQFAKLAEHHTPDVKLNSRRRPQLTI